LGECSIGAVKASSGSRADADVFKFVDETAKTGWDDPRRAPRLDDPQTSGEEIRIIRLEHVHRDSEALVVCGGIGGAKFAADGLKERVPGERKGLAGGGKLKGKDE